MDERLSVFGQQIQLRCTHKYHLHTHTHKHKFNQVSLSISFRFIVFHLILDSFVSHRWWSLLLLLLWTKWNPMILSRFELMVSLCRLYSVQVLSVIRLKINKPKINNDKELKDWAQSIPIENRWDFFFLYHFLVKLRYRKFISIVVHTIHNTHAHTPNVERSMRSDHMPMSHQWQNNQTHQSGLNGAYLHRIDAKVCCHFWGFDKSMKCKKGLAYYSIHKKKPIVLSWFFRNVQIYSHQRCHFTLNYFLIHFKENSIYAYIVCSYFALNRSIHRNHICLEIKKRILDLKFPWYENTKKKWIFKIFFEFFSSFMNNFFLFLFILLQSSGGRIPTFNKNISNEQIKCHIKKPYGSVAFEWDTNIKRRFQYL